MTSLHRQPDRPGRPQAGRLPALAALVLVAWAGPAPPAAPAQPPEPPAQPPVARPAGQDEDVLEYADLLYSRDQFALAAQQYQIFIREHPESPNIQAAWFRLGECYLQVEQTEDAVATFSYLVGEFKRGPFVGSAAYRLAVMRFNERDFRNALAYFKVAKDELSNPEAKLQARFYYARSLQLTEQPREAVAEFRAVVETDAEGENPFRERALLETARLQFELGNTEDALERFRQLAETASSEEFREEAVVRGGLLAAEVGQPELSEELLSEALRFPDTSPWKPLAQAGTIFNAYSRGDYERVIALYNTGTITAPEESRAKMLLVVGHSFRIEGDLDSALRLYSLVEGRYGDRSEGIEAGYRKLQILHQQGDSTLPELAERFVERQRQADPESSFIDMAWLMKAEWHFSQAENAAGGTRSDYAKKHYGDAAAAYNRVRVENIDEKFHEIRLYKQGWAEIESGDPAEGILTLSRFLERHRGSALASSALAKRAIAYQTQEDHAFALGDYQEIVSRHPEAPEVEFALQQIALIRAHRRETAEMIEAYAELLERFPETEGRAEARYWMGVGHFDLEDYGRAVPELEQARELDEEFEDKATLRLVISHYQLENIPELTAEARRYLDPPGGTAAEEARTQIPPQVIEYLGRKLAADGEFEDAEFFLASLSTPEDPAATTASVWGLLAECRMQIRKYEEAVAAYDHFLLQTERPSERASAYLQRGIAQLCLRDYDAARGSAQESLRSQKEGRTNAEARILLGDIAAAAGNLEDAAREYLVVSQIFTDPEVTPLALAKAAKAYRSLGNQERAAELLRDLNQRFPSYEIPEKLDREC